MRLPLSIAPITLAVLAISTSIAGQAADQPTSAESVCGFSSSIRFIEGAPRDRFFIANNSSETWDITAINVDLSASAGNLFFDVTGDGAGVEVFQPFRTENGEAKLREQPRVDDGQQSILLSFSTFSPDQEYVFSIDIDDQLTQSELGQIRVSGGEMQGATLTLNIINSQDEALSITGVFDSTNQLTLNGANC